jgi:hypothetical protein
VLLLQAIFRASSGMVLAQIVCNAFSLHQQKRFVDWLMRHRAPDQPCASRAP